MTEPEEAAPCFDVRDLERMLADQLDDREREAIEAHIEGCPACQATLERITGGADSSADASEAMEVAGLIDRLQKEGPPPAEAGRPSPIRPRSATSTPFEGAKPSGEGAESSGQVGPPIAGFRLIREVGRGGMGIVYEAVELALGRRVALKVVANEGFGTSTRVERFRREARAAARLHHTNIVPVFGVGEGGAWLYYAMQFIDGQGLDAFIGRLRREGDGSPRPTDRGTTPGEASPPETIDLATASAIVVQGAPTLASPTPSPSPSSATLAGPASTGSTSSGSSRVQFRASARIGKQIAEALAFAHHHGILHRDVKPSNILIDEAGDAWVTDFGLAKSFEGAGEALTRTGDLVGTLRYMAPERFEGRSDVAGDIYALGATLYELLALRPAFEEPTQARLIERVLREDPVRPRAIDPKIPRDLETIALKAMAKEPMSRYASASEMAEDFRLYLAGEPIRARRVGPFERAIRWSKRNPAVAGLASAFVLAVTIGLALTLWKWREAEGQTVRAVQAEADIAQERDRARRLTAELSIDRGLQLLARGETTEGRHWLARSLEIPEIAPESSRLAGQNLDAWNDACPELVQVIAGPSPFTDFAISPDGQTVHAIERAHLTLRHFDVATGAERGQPSALPSMPTGVPNSYQFVGRGRSIVIVHSGTKAFEVADAATGKPKIGPIPTDAEGDPFRYDLSPDESAIAINPEAGAIQVFDLETGRTLGPKIRPGGPVGGRFALWPGGTRLLTTGPGGGQFWDVATGRPLAKAPAIPARPERLAIDLRGRPISFELETTPSSAEPALTTRFFDREGSPGGVIRGETRLSTNQGGITFWPGGETLVLGHHPGEVGLYDIERGVRRGNYLAAEGRVTSIAASPDGASIATGRPDGRVELWDAAGAARRMEFPSLGSVLGLSFTPDGRGIAVLQADGSIRLWRLPASPVPAGRRSPADSWGMRVAGNAAFTRTADRTLILASGGGRARIVDSKGLPTGEPLTVRWPNRHLLAVSRDGRRWATASHGLRLGETELRLWDAEGRPIASHLPHENWIVAIAFSPDGKTLAAAGYGGQVWSYDAETGRPIGKPLRTGRVTMSLAFSPDGKTLAVGTGPSSPLGLTFQVQLWDLASGLRAQAVEHARLDDRAGLQPRRPGAPGQVRPSVGPVVFRPLSAPGRQDPPPPRRAARRAGARPRGDRLRLPRTTPDVRHRRRLGVGRRRRPVRPAGHPDGPTAPGPLRFRRRAVAGHSRRPGRRPGLRPLDLSARRTSAQGRSAPGRLGLRRRRPVGHRGRRGCHPRDSRVARPRRPAAPRHRAGGPRDRDGHDARRLDRLDPPPLDRRLAPTPRRRRAAAPLGEPRR